MSRDRAYDRDEAYEAESEKRESEYSGSLFPYAGSRWPSAWGWWSTDDQAIEEEYPNQSYDSDVADPSPDETNEAARTVGDPYYEDGVSEDDDSLLGESLIGLILIAGVVLFLFPEPITSTLGIVLLVGGVLLWLLFMAT